jgi:hypothetical protein
MFAIEVARLNERFADLSSSLDDILKHDEELDGIAASAEQNVIEQSTLNSEEIVDEELSSPTTAEAEQGSSSSTHPASLTPQLNESTASEMVVGTHRNKGETAKRWTTTQSLVKQVSQ